MSRERNDFTAFIEAQNSGITSKLQSEYKLDRTGVSHEEAIEEIKQRKKEKDWIWYVFPQLKGPGSSSTTKYFAIHDLDEAKLYLQHEQLGKNFREATQALNSLLLEQDSLSLEKMFGSIDYNKLISSMTLFSEAAYSIPDKELVTQINEILDKAFEQNKKQVRSRRDPSRLAASQSATSKKIIDLLTAIQQSLQTGAASYRETTIESKRDHIKKHISERFATLKEMLLLDPKRRVIIAGTAGKVATDLADDSVRVHYGKFGHQLGTLRAKKQWGDNNIWQEVVNHISEEVEKLKKEFFKRVDIGNVGYEKYGYFSVTNLPSNEYIHVWGANSDNWNKEISGIFSGEGQAASMSKKPQQVGCFGIVTTPYEWKNDARLLHAEDKTHGPLIEQETREKSFKEMKEIISSDDLKAFQTYLSETPNLLNIDFTSYFSDENEHEASHLIHLICQKGAFKILNYLINQEKYRDEFIRELHNGQFPIHIIVKKGHYHCLDLFLSKFPQTLSQKVKDNQWLNVFSLSCNDFNDANLRLLILMRKHSIHASLVSEFKEAEEVIKRHSSSTGLHGANRSLMLGICQNKYDHIIEAEFNNPPDDLDQAINAAIKEIRKIQLEELIKRSDRSQTQIPALFSKFVPSDLSENMKIFLLSEREFYNRNSLRVDEKLKLLSTPYLNESATNGEPYFFYASNNPELFSRAVIHIDMNKKSSNGETLWDKLCSEENSQNVDIHKLQVMEIIAFQFALKKDFSKLEYLQKNFQISLSPYEECFAGDHSLFPALNYPKLEQLQDAEFSFKSVTTNSNNFYDRFDLQDDMKGKLEIDREKFVIYYNDRITKRILLMPSKQGYPSEPRLYYSEFTAEELQFLEIPLEYQEALRSSFKPTKFAHALSQDIDTKPKNISQSPQNIDTILSSNQGLFFGDDHSDKNLIEMMQEFCTSKQVKRIYLELPITEIGNLLENYNICKEDHEKFYLDKIEHYIKKRLHSTKNADEFCQLIKNAKTHGVKLIAIDGIRRISRQNEQSIFSTGAEGVLSTDRLSGDDAIAKFIQYQQTSCTEDKFVVFYGAAHAKIAQELDIPSMYLGKKYKGMESYDYDKYSPKSKQLSSASLSSDSLSSATSQEDEDLAKAIQLSLQTGAGENIEIQKLIDMLSYSQLPEVDSDKVNLKRQYEIFKVLSDPYNEVLSDPYNEVLSDPYNEVLLDPYHFRIEKTDLVISSTKSAYGQQDVDGENLRSEHLKNLKTRLDKQSGFTYSEKDIQGRTKFLKINLAQENEFVQSLPIVKLNKYVKDLESNSDLREEFCAKVFDIATKLDKYINSLKHDVKAEIEAIRRRSHKSYQDGSGVYQYTKPDINIGVDYGQEKLNEKFSEYQYYRVLIDDECPFWISIDVITGEFVIRLREDWMMPSESIASHFLTKAKEIIKKDEPFKSIVESAEEDVFYHNPNSLYFTQNAFNRLKQQAAKSKVKPNDEEYIPILEEGNGKVIAVKQYNDPTMSGRILVVVKFNSNKQMLFYRSSGLSGSRSKQAGDWYPFFGISSDTWLIKFTLNDERQPIGPLILNLFPEIKRIMSDLKSAYDHDEKFRNMIDNQPKTSFFGNDGDYSKFEKLAFPDDTISKELEIMGDRLVASDSQSDISKELIKYKTLFFISRLISGGFRFKNEEDLKDLDLTIEEKNAILEPNICKIIALNFISLAEQHVKFIFSDKCKAKLKEATSINEIIVILKDEKLIDNDFVFNPEEDSVYGKIFYHMKKVQRNAKQQAAASVRKGLGASQGSEASQGAFEGRTRNSPITNKSVRTNYWLQEQDIQTIMEAYEQEGEFTQYSSLDETGDDVLIAPAINSPEALQRRNLRFGIADAESLQNAMESQFDFFFSTRSNINARVKAIVALLDRQLQINLKDQDNHQHDELRVKILTLAENITLNQIEHYQAHLSLSLQTTTPNELINPVTERPIILSENIGRKLSQNARAFFHAFEPDQIANHDQICNEESKLGIILDRVDQMEIDEKFRVAIPYQIHDNHWNSLIVDIHKDQDQAYHFTLTQFDPYGGKETLNPEMINAFIKKITQGVHHFRQKDAQELIDPKFYVSHQTAPKLQQDGSLCGAITAKSLCLLAKKKNRNKTFLDICQDSSIDQPYPVGGQELRESQLRLVQNQDPDSSFLEDAYFHSPEISSKEENIKKLQELNNIPQNQEELTIFLKTLLQFPSHNLRAIIQTNINKECHSVIIMNALIKIFEMMKTSSQAQIHHDISCFLQPHLSGSDIKNDVTSSSKEIPVDNYMNQLLMINGELPSIPACDSGIKEEDKADLIKKTQEYIYLLFESSINNQNLEELQDFLKKTTTNLGVNISRMPDTVSTKAEEEAARAKEKTQPQAAIEASKVEAAIPTPPKKEASPAEPPPPPREQKATAMLDDVKQRLDSLAKTIDEKIQKADDIISKYKKLEVANKETQRETKAFIDKIEEIMTNGYNRGI